MAKRKVNGKKIASKEHVVIERVSYDSCKPAWMFDRIDRNGKFAFDVSRKDFDIHLVFDKLLSYSTMTWGEIDRQTHDWGKSKNHHLDYQGMSQEAKERIRKMQLEEEIDAIYSLSFENQIRIVGIKDKGIFRIIWYDPEHEIYPSTKRNT